MVNTFFKLPSNILFYGPNGVGKTHLLVAMYKVAAHLCGFVGNGGPLFVEWAALVQNIKDGFSDGTSSGILHEYTAPKILFIDDVTVKMSSFDRDIFGKIIVNRYNTATFIVMTSNDSDSSLLNSLGSHESSRLLDNFTAVEILGKDRRCD